MKFARVLFAAALLAACSPKTEEKTDAPAAAEVTTVRLNADNNYAAAATGWVEYAAAGGDLSTAVPVLRLTTERGQVYDLTFVSEVDPTEAVNGDATWDSMLNPSAGLPIRLYSSRLGDGRSAGQAGGFCDSTEVTFVALGRRESDGARELRIVPFTTATQPSATAKAEPCGTFTYAG